MPPRMRRRITTAKREEIEAEQRLLDKQIVRPFETVEGLPISYNKPPHGHYEDVLKNPLTMKDSAVLYNSLIRSRNTYVFHAPMFKLYWVKQTAYAKKLAEMEKGPQPSKERETRRRFAKATSNSLEAKTRTPILSGDVNARDVMSKLSEATLSLGPHSMEIRIFIAKDARSEKSKAFSEISQVSDGSDLLMKKEPPAPAPAPAPAPVPNAAPNAAPAPSQPTSSGSPPAADPGTTPPSAVPNPNSTPGVTNTAATPSSTPSNSEAAETKKEDAKSQSPPKAAASPENNKSSEKPQEAKEAPADTQKDVKEEDGSSKEGAKEAPKADEKESTTDATSSKPSPAPTTAQSPPGPPATSSSPTPGPSAGGTQPTAASPAPGAPPGGPPGSFPRPPPPRAVDMTTVDNAIMISNLNAIAKIDLSLNDLMKVVAKGTASEAQINLFKRYIERAKQMGPQPHHAELYLVRGLPLPPNFPRPYSAKPFAPPRPPKPKFNNPMKLTAFQEKYLYNATLVFEFLENPNVRYVIPRDSICEVQPPANPVTLEDGSGVRDILVSNIWIHNIEDVEAYEKKLAEYEDQVREKEEEERKKKEEEEKAKKQEEGSESKTDESASAPVEPKPEPEEPVPQRSSRSGRNKKPPPTRKKAKPLEKPDEPPVRYTTYSFTLHGIPEKFVPIVVNSMRPMRLVQEKMEKILKIGNRVSSFHLWYQVDAKLDEDVAEDLRQSVIQEEKKMTGVTPQSIEREQPKKRKREFKNPRPKKPKDESPSAGAPVPPFNSGGTTPTTVPSSAGNSGVSNTMAPSLGSQAPLAG
ncbi:hypothetical protein FT663_00438 [Candidozyma haemuli var. vulneris]|nr:hypothetical protein FT662_00544 [[Candida] haemuloni var. vulneris]KAF3995385.1 hypothetical protein FT663_00438 [[Candida] haemuloni var. vulneris]